MNDVSCPICGSIKLRNIITRKNVPVHQNLILKDINKAKGIPKGNIKLMLCNDCGFIFNREFELSKLSYGDFYDNNQENSKEFTSYLENEIEYLIKNYDLNNKTVVEVGCGQGDFLKKIVNMTNCKGIGFDPSYRENNEVFNGNLTFEKKYYGSSCKDVKADFVICRHVIEHIPNPFELLKELKIALQDSNEPYVFFECHTIEWTFKNKVIYNFFYEYCSYFYKESLQYIFDLAGFNIIDLKERFNGQYLWIVAKLSKSSKRLKNGVDKITALVNEYLKNEEIVLEHLNKMIEELNSIGKLAVWGAGAKGTIFANMFDKNCNDIDCMVDINVNKQGGFIAGTSHRIVGISELKNRNIKSIIVLNPVYFNEIKDILLKNNLNHIELINLEEEQCKLL